MNIYLGIDLGTTVIKITAIDDTGKILSSRSKEILYSSTQTNWAEESTLQWWNTIKKLLEETGKKIDLSYTKGIGLSGQMHGLVCYDKTYEVLRPAIIWADKRSTKEVEDMTEKIGTKKIYSITGNPIFTGFLLPSLFWIKRNDPSLFKKIAKVSSPKDFVIYKLTGVLRSEPTDALATAAFDYQKNEWSTELIEAAGISPGLFPEIDATAKPYGTVTLDIAKRTNIPVGTPVFGGSDQSMAAMGCGLVEENTGMIAISTGGQFLVVSKKGFLDKNRRLHTLNHALDGTGLYMAATLSAGLSLKWFKTNIAKEADMSYDDFVRGVDTIPLGSDGLFFLPFLAGERTPYFNPALRATLTGFTLQHSRLHVVRGIMEGVAYSMKDCLQVFKDMKMPITQIILSGGGAKDPTWRQIITDVLNMPTEIINISDHSPFGAAVFAKFAQEGFEKLPAFYKKVIHKSNKLMPIPENVKMYDKLFKEYKRQVSFYNQ